MSYRLFLLVFVMITNVDGLKVLSNTPQPMTGLLIPKMLGQWFAVHRKPPCTWSGSKEFVNLGIFFKYEGKDTISSQITWGDEFCNKVFAKDFMESPPGVLLKKDSFGDNISGKAVIIATDYKTYLIKWGCTKFSVFGEKCDDPYVVVLTRVPKPTKFTLANINVVLSKTWGLTIKDLDMVLQTGTGACYGGKKI
ncbi:hypothetical protein ACF0H5_012637 [Mactra antiquata]